LSFSFKVPSRGELLLNFISAILEMLMKVCEAAIQQPKPSARPDFPITLDKLYNNGEWRDSHSGKTFPAIDPTTESEIARLAEGTIEDVELAVQSAETAFIETWGQMSGHERGEILRRIGDWFFKYGLGDWESRHSQLSIQSGAGISAQWHLWGNRDHLRHGSSTRNAFLPRSDRSILHYLVQATARRMANRADLQVNTRIQTMKIGIIGGGNIARGLGKFWAENGHELMFSFSRNEQKLKDLARSVSDAARVGTPAEAVQFADVVLLAVPWEAVPKALQAAGSLSGKLLFSCVNALNPDMSGMAVGTATSAAEEIAKLAPGARVVEGLPLFAEVLDSGNTQFNGQEATVFYCGDDAEAKSIVAGLLRETATEAIDVGALSAARYIEPAMMVLIQLAYVQQMGQVAFKLLRR
jgi:8-hydroxy-5-deazaflavin:NADPH oxidoreductase